MYTLEQCRGTTDQGFLNKKKIYHTPLKWGFIFWMNMTSTQYRVQTAK